MSILLCLLTARLRSSFLGLFPARIQTVEDQNRVVDKKVAALRFTTPHGVIGKQHDVTVAIRHVNDRRALRDVGRIAKSLTAIQLPNGSQHAPGNANNHRRYQAVGRAAEEASLTSTRRAGAWRSSINKRKTPISGTTRNAHSA